jgi:hypothetical protein
MRAVAGEALGVQKRWSAGGLEAGSLTYNVRRHCVKGRGLQLRFRTSSAVGLLLLTACIPGRVTSISELSGVVLKDSLPAANVEVLYQVVAPGEAQLQTVTDSTGSFQIAGKREWGWYLFPPGHCYIRWRAVFTESGAGQRSEFSREIYGPCYPPKRVELRCDLSEEAQEVCQVLTPEFLAEWGKPIATDSM